MRKLNPNDPVDKAIIDMESVLAKLTGKATPFALITEDMTEEEVEMELFEALLKQGVPEAEATVEAKNQLKKLKAVERLL